ncbi:GrpE protein [Haliangium ochraceum DSM 14365]|uniref:Protein GrpE n=1 Tax=Haliangium ochraceum (strain DSM 14365 / JCM 11303 / SMP-2) TaxID=502025 RepID=D0LKN7_HALO1|nr:GrpE protein [Haliangium ochraceum DSM 14365]
MPAQSPGADSAQASGEADKNPAEASAAQAAEAPAGEGSAPTGDVASEAAASEAAAEAATDRDADEAATGPSAEERIATLEADNAQLAKEKQENWERVLRATADLDNFRKRSRREVDDARTESRSKVLREMLPVIDNLERAIEHAESSDEGANSTSVIDGVKLVLRQFGQALERCEVKPVDAFGKPFDPTIHEAISQMESAEHAPGSVVQVLQKGYTIGARLLRPSLVVVAKAPAEPAPAASADGEGGEGGESSDADGGEA